MIIAVYAPTDYSALKIKDKFEATLTDVLWNVGCRKDILSLENLSEQTESPKYDNVIGQYDFPSYIDAFFTTVN